jgi:hypothetical protein
MGAPPGFRSEAAAPASAAPQERGAGGGSFLGTAAAAAAGVIGGSLLLDGIRSMFGHGQGAFGAMGQAHAGQSQSPWGDSAAGSDLARQAGLDDIGRGPGNFDPDAGARSYGLFGTSKDDLNDLDRDDDADDLDLGGDFDLGLDE